jgi:nucleotidyltransferase substrate binding protein (TIGR01987 family)
MIKFESVFEDFQKVIKMLDEVLKQEKNEFIRDSAIKRFEFCFDLFWKTLKAFLEDYYKIRCASPKTCFQEAFNQGLIDYDEMWLKIADWRNDVVHIYKEKAAEKLYKKLPRALKYFQLLKERVEEKFKE